MTPLRRWALVRYWDINVHGRTDAIAGSKVFVDGEQQRAVTAFNVDEGWVRRLVLDEEGRAQLDPNGSDRCCEETVRGEVVWLPG